MQAEGPAPRNAVFRRAEAPGGCPRFPSR